MLQRQFSVQKTMKWKEFRSRRQEIIDKYLTARKNQHRVVLMLKLMQLCKAAAKSNKNFRSKIKFYSDLKKKKQLTNRLMVKWRILNLKYGNKGILDKLSS